MKNAWIKLLITLVFMSWFSLARGAESVEKSVPVRTQLLKLKQYTEYAEYLGVVRGASVAHLESRAGGTVLGLKVQLGDAVKKGDFLCNIDGKRFDYELEAAQLNQKVAQMEFSRLSAHRKQGNASDVQLSKAKMALANAKKATYVATKMRDSAYCMSPLSGVVIRKSIFLHDEVKAGMPTFSVADFSSVEVAIGVPELDSTYYQKGGKIWIHVAGQAAVDSEPNWIEGSFKGISRYIDPKDRHVKAEVVAVNPNGKFVDGQTVKVRVLKHSISNAVVVPSKAIISKGSKRYVMVVKDNVVSANQVKVFSSNGQESAISAGVSEGVFIVTEGNHQVLEGDSIRVIP